MGTIYGDKSRFSREIVGGVEPPHLQFGGAALLILLREK